MTSLLWVEGSPKADRSLSTACARAFLDELRAAESDIEITHRDVWADDLVEFGREAALAKFGPLFGEPHTPEQERIWEEVMDEIDLVRTHDHLVVSSPMWNWSVPHALKRWIDVIVQPLYSFTLDGDGRHVGVLGVGKVAHFILTRSSAYDGRHPELEDHQESYLRYLFDMLGFAVDDPLIIEPTTAWTPEEREAIADEALERAAQDGRRFAGAHLGKVQ